MADGNDAVIFQRHTNIGLNARLKNVANDEEYRAIVDTTKKVLNPKRVERLKRLQENRQTISMDELPRHLQSAIQELGVLDEEDSRKRAEIFIGYCVSKNYSLNTCRRYLALLRAAKIIDNEEPENAIRPLVNAFNANARLHIRSIDMDSFIKFVLYVKDNFTRFYAPILVAIYTSLRTHEILKFSVKNLVELRRKQRNISIVRKQTDRKRGVNQPAATPVRMWQPVYTAHLMQFVEQLTSLYSDYMENFLTNGINLKLFPITDATLRNRVRHAYFQACGSNAPYGFGIQGIRTMLAVYLSHNTDNIVAVSQFLQHKSSRTSYGYLRRVDDSRVRDKFDEIISYEFANTNV